MKKKGKERLFEMMEKLNPDFKEDNYHENDGTYYKPKLKDIIDMATQIEVAMKDSDDLDAWVQDKLSVTYHNLDAILGYLKRENDDADNTDLVAGGKADKLTIEDIAQKHNVSVESIKQQIEKGKKVEMEHTDNEAMAEEIAMDHLEEFSDYYTRLDKMESKAKTQIKESVNISLVDSQYNSILELIKRVSRKLNDDDAYLLHEKLKNFFNKLF